MDCLRTQPNQASSHDLVAEVYQLLAALEPELDADNVGLARKAVETMTELVQGNTSLGNATRLLQTKLVAILQRIVEKETLGFGAAGQSAPHIDGCS